MEIINKNPYRYLGVYSNSPTKERVANKGKMNAFLKVGKPVSFPLDLPKLLPGIDRTTETVANAESQLTLPADQIRYAQFWWMNSTPLDAMAFNHLTEGNATTALEIWNKKVCASSLQNKIVLALIKADYATAIKCAETLYTNYTAEFQSLVLGEGTTTSDDIWKFFIDKLLEESKRDLSSFISKQDWKAYTSEKTVGPIIDSIAKAIDTAKAMKGKGPNVRLQAGKTLMSVTKEALAKLKSVLPTTDIRLQSIADKLANEILQCGIDYYNNSEEDECAEIAMELQKYALSIALGSMTKQRCKENVDTLQKAIDSLPPAQVRTQYKKIEKELDNYCQKPDKICHAVTLLNNCRPLLQSMKAVIGGSNASYLEISTIVVSNALHNIIEEVNEAQQQAKLDILLHNSSYAMNQIKNVMQNAWQATLIMDSFDMEYSFKTSRYNENRKVLKGLCDQLGVSTRESRYSTKTRSNSNSSRTTNNVRTATASPTHSNSERQAPQSKTKKEGNNGCLWQLWQSLDSALLVQFSMVLKVFYVVVLQELYLSDFLYYHLKIK